MNNNAYPRPMGVLPIRRGSVVKHVLAKEIVRFTQPSQYLRQVAALAADLEAAGLSVCVKWARDDRGDIIGVSICEAVKEIA